MRVLVFGDSIAYGAWDTAGGWVERLKAEAHKQTVESGLAEKVQILNLGIGGDTSTKILERLRNEIEVRISPSWPNVLVISYNANDERAVDGVVETAINQFETNTREIITLARQFAERILFVGNAPLSKDIIIFKGQEYSDERIRAYEASLAQILSEENIPFVQLRPIFEGAGLEGLYSSDGLHPNDKGHELIANTVKPKLWELLK